jgi:N-acetyl-anhydromuramyl-L-alanine amidase AmpD
VVDFTNIPFVQAKWFTRAQPGRKVSLLVLHSMEAPEKGSTAESVARYFANGSGGRPASAHYCIDSDSIVQCVQTRDVAYGAPGANRNGIHLEHAGYARQTAKDWADPFSEAMLEPLGRSGRENLDPEVRDYAPVPRARWICWPCSRGHALTGITTHREISLAFNPGGHTDPGENFPIDHYLDMVRNA